MLKTSSMSRVLLLAVLACLPAAAQRAGVPRRDRASGALRHERRDVMEGQHPAPPANALRPQEQVHPAPQQPAADATNFQRPGHLGYWLRQNRNLSLEQQRQALTSDPQFRALSPERQQNLVRSLERFNNMPPQQQERVLRNMEIMEHWTPEQRLQARLLVERARQLPPERREEVRKAISYLRHQEPPRRQEMLAAPDFKGRFNDQERDIITGALDLGLPAGRVNPRRRPDDAPPPPPQQ
jgi:hypothetical protein